MYVQQANATLNQEQAGFYRHKDYFPLQIGVRSSRPDTGVLTVTCDIAFTASGRASDAGKSVRISARVQNTEATHVTSPAYRGWTGMTGDNKGGFVGVILSRTPQGEPFAQTFAGFNRQRYFSPATALIPKPQKVAKLFPIVDYFVPDGDLATREEAYSMMQRMGINTPSGVVDDSVTPPGWGGRTVGIPWGKVDPAYGVEGVLGVGGQFRKGSELGRPHYVPCSTPNSSCTLHDYCTLNATDATLVNATDINGAVASQS